MAQRDVEMTTEELRDWHARKAGWVPPGESLPAGPGTSWPQDPPGSVIAGGISGWVRLDDRKIVERQHAHPCPPTIDGAASVMPEGWSWIREYTTNLRDPEKGLVLMWIGFHDSDGDVRLEDTNDEIHDRYLLAKLAKEAMNAQSR